MSNLSLSHAEQRIFRLASFRDGLWDILLGSMFIVLGFFPTTRSLLGPVLNAILILIVLSSLGISMVYLRRQITIPRIGLVSMGTGRKGRIVGLVALTITLVVATGWIMIIAATRGGISLNWAWLPNWASDYAIDILFGLVAVAVLSVMAWVLGIPRLHLYGWLIGISMVSSAMLGEGNESLINFPSILAGGIITLIGVILLISFLKKYPVPTPEEA